MTAPQRRKSEDGKPAVRRPKGERRRELLVFVKLVLHRVGFAAATAAEVALAAGVSESVLARHFPEKTDYLKGVVEELRTAILAPWEAETAERTDPLGRLHSLAESFLAAASSQAADFRILLRAVSEGDDAALALFNAIGLEVESLLTQIISEGQQTGVFRRSLDPRVGAWDLIRGAVGYAVTAPLGLSFYSEPEYIARAIDCQLHCLVKTDV